MNFVLRPYSIGTAITGLFLVFRKEWLWGSGLFAAWFLISAIGSGVEKPQFYWGKVPDAAASAAPTPLSHEDSYLIAKAIFKTASILAVIALFALIRFGTHWYFAVPLGWLLGTLAITLPAGLVFVLIAIRSKLR